MSVEHNVPRETLYKLTKYIIMDRNQDTDLYNFIINPALLELMKVQERGISIPSWLCFRVERNGISFDFTLYPGKNGQVNIKRSDNMMQIIISDHCKTPQDFEKLLEKLDDLITRFPPIKIDR